MLKPSAPEMPKNMKSQAKQAINEDSGFQHRSLQERAEAYGGKLTLSTEEIDWGEPVEGEV